MGAKLNDKELAIKEGRITYTGYSCKHCKGTTRYTSNGHCVECSKEKNNPLRKAAALKYSKSEKGRGQQARSRSRTKDRSRDNKLQKMYGISLNEYNNMLMEQNYSCKICSKHQDEEVKRLSVDHCHETGKVRGLLCRQCNTALGQFNDDVGMLRKAIEYLNEQEVKQMGQEVSSYCLRSCSLE